MTENHLTARLATLLQYIEENLNEPLTVSELAKQVYCSEYHFQRWFLSQCQLPVMTYIQLLRMQRAASALAYRDTPVTLLAQEAGYQYSESFSRAFRRWFEQSPAEFRKNPDWLRWWQVLTSPRPAITAKPEVAIVELPSTAIVLQIHQGHPALLGQTIRDFISWRKANQLPPSKYATYNLLYDDPRVTEPSEYRFGLAVAAATVEVSPPRQISSIAGGRYARIRWQGADDHLATLIDYLYHDWLPSSNEQFADQPIVLQRLRFFPDVAAHLAETDILLPLAPNPLFG